MAIICRKIWNYCFT